MNKLPKKDRNDHKFTKKAAGRILLTALSACFWIGVWYILALCVGQEWILPTPLAVGRAFVSALGDFKLPLFLLRSSAGILSGYAAGVVAGFLLSALTARVRALHILFSPLLTVVRATPVASFILILWIFFARSTVPAVSVFLIVLPIVWGNCETGFLSADRQLLEAAQSFGMSFGRKMRFVYLPAAAPYLRASALTALGMAWKAGVAAEVLCTPEGTLGRMIWISKRDIETADLFAYTAAVILFCFLLERLLRALFEAAAKRRRPATGTKEARDDQN